MITFTNKGSFDKTENFLKKITKAEFTSVLHKFGEKGVKALRDATPKDSGDTANSWEYEIVKGIGSVRLIFKNTNIQNGANVAILLQYGHATRNGGYVQGRDYINPALSPIFDSIAKEAWEEVRKA